MTQGVLKNPPLCKRCGKVKAVKYYCPACSKLVAADKKNLYRQTHGIGQLIIPGIKRAPSLTIVSDPLEPGGFPPGVRFVGKIEIMSMLSSHAFTDNTIVRAGHRLLKIVNNKFEPV